MCSAQLCLSLIHHNQPGAATHIQAVQIFQITSLNKHLKGKRTVAGGFIRNSETKTFGGTPLILFGSKLNAKVIATILATLHYTTLHLHNRMSLYIYS